MPDDSFTPQEIEFEAKQIMDFWLLSNEINSYNTDADMKRRDFDVRYYITDAISWLLKTNKNTTMAFKKRFFDEIIYPNFQAFANSNPLAYTTYEDLSATQYALII